MIKGCDCGSNFNDKTQDWKCPHELLPEQDTNRKQFVPEPKKTIELLLSAQAYRDLLELERTSKYPLAHIIGTGIGLFRLAIAEEDRGNKFIICRGAKALREILLPSPLR